MLSLGKEQIPVRHMLQTLEFFRELMDQHPSPSLLSRQIRHYFDLLPGPGRADALLVTGYYRPLYEGRLTRSPPYIHPLYAVPSDLARKKSPGTNTVEIGRLAGAHFLPYWTRKEIETQGKAQGRELVYLRDPFQAFLVHVQGSALIRLGDGSVRTIHYAMKNGHPYRSIGRYLVKTGRIPAAGADLAAIRSYLRQHPDQITEILHHNPSFIFFSWQKDNAVMGSLNRALTPGRSVAADHRWLPAGGLAFLRTRPTRRPGRSDPALHRFVLIQDSGSAIRGPERLDLYLGTGDEAGAAAGRMKDSGQLVFPLLKKEFRPLCLSKGQRL